jgi:hypothetical protein
MAPFQRVDHESRKEKVVYGIAFLCDFLMNTGSVFSMDLGEDRQLVFLGNVPQTLQVIPGTGPVKEIRLAWFFVQVCECIQANNFCSVLAEFAKGFIVELPDQL